MQPSAEENTEKTEQTEPKPENQEKQEEQKPLQQTQKQPEFNPLDLSNQPIPENAIVIHFEVCINCSKKHAFCTQHNELRYAELYHSFKKKVEAAIPNSFCLVNHFTKQPSIGAFEITHQGKIIFSKKNSGLFPTVEPTIERIKRFLDDLNNKKDVSGYAKTKERKQEVPIEKKSKPTFQAYIKMKEQEFARQEAIREENERKRLEQEEKEKQEAERQEEERLKQLEKEKEEKAKADAAAEEARKKKEEEDKAKAEQEAKEKAANGENQEGVEKPAQKEGEKAEEQPAE